MRLQDNIDFTTLNWVKQELDETLNQARQALESYVEDSNDPIAMRSCATYLHQVQGTLRMVELYGAAMVVEEMERVALALLDATIKPQDETYAVLMRGIVQLPDYLERLQSGHKDIPIVLLPLLNDLRACRGEKFLSESVLFSPDMSVAIPVGNGQALPEKELRSTVSKLRGMFQTALLKWFRADATQEHLNRLLAVLERLHVLCVENEARRLWWIAGGVLEAVHANGLEASVAVKLLIGKVDREIKRLVDVGEAGFGAEPPRELVKNLLYYITHATITGERGNEIRRIYKLDTLLPSQQELDHAKGSMSGHNRTLLDTVSLAIKEDLLRVKEALDIFLRASNNNPGDLLVQVDVLDRIGDTLGMLGLGVPRRVVLEQRQIVEEIANKSRPTDEGTLLDVAGALLYVEASLDDHIDRLGAHTPEDDGLPTEMGLPKAEVRKILDVLMKEAAINIAQAKQDIVAFIESPWDHAKVESIPRLLEEISGALHMLALGEPAQLVEGVVRFVKVELLRHKRVPTTEQMDKLADALASLEYYLEATREQRGGREKILDVTRKSLEVLGYWPVPSGDDGGGSPKGNPDPSPSNPIGSLAETALSSSTSTATLATPATATGIARAALNGVAPVSEQLASEQPVLARSVSAMAPAEKQELSFNEEMDVSASSDFPSWGEDLPTSGDASLQIDAIPQGDDSLLPSIELPQDASIDAFIASLNREENLTAPEITPAALLPEHELNVSVEVAPGSGLEDLIVGDMQESLVPAADAHDIKGLRLVETETLKDAAIDASNTAFDAYTEFVEEIEEEVVEEDSTVGGFQAMPSEDVDEEIRSVFIDEVQEEIANLKRHFPMWRSDVQDFEKLKPIRRSFHTLKGSGRLVGAFTLGEFGWKIENMLNRVLDKTIEPSPAVQALIDQSIGALPELLAALRGEGSPQSNITGIMEVADQLASGAIAWVQPSKPHKVKKIKRLVRKRVLDVPAAMPDVDSQFVVPPEIPDNQLASESAVESSLVALESNAPAMASLPSIDPVLFETLRSEVATHLSVIDDYLIQAGRQALPVSEPLLRAVHTLNGAIAMVDIPVVSQVVAPLEGYVKRLRAANMVPTAAGLMALAQASGLIKTVMLAFETGRSELPNSEELANRISALRDALPEPESVHTLFGLIDDVDGDELLEANAPEDIVALELSDKAPTPSANAPTATDNNLQQIEEESAAATPIESVKPRQDESLTINLRELESAAILPPSELSAADLASLEQARQHAEIQIQPDLHPVISPVVISELPPIPDDPQPEGRLELADMDEDLLEIFVQEGSDILDHSDGLIAGLRESPQDRDLITGLQRDLHTLKGGARMAGLAPIGDLSHVMESLLEAISENRRSMDRGVVESLERGFDRLHGLVQRVAKHQAIAMPQHAIGRFEALVSGKLLSQLSAAIQEVVPKAAEPIVHITPRPAVTEEDDTQRAPQEMIRVRSELLDSLVNYAGEVSIYRSRLEQQISTFRFNLVEFDQTVNRLRDQLRKLEIETEAQILSRYQREAESIESTFDPLELDRFSHLQQLSRALAESVSDLVSIQGLLDEVTRQSETLLLQQSRVSSDLQEGLMRTRMVPFDSLVPSLRRTLRQAANELGKRAQLKVEGAQGEMDRNLLERMKAPFEHMLRNALAHGIEAPEERQKAGKAAEGTVNIAVSREATEVVLRFSDDGRGMDRDAIRQKAIERGLLRSDAQLSDRDLYGFVIETGFSTAEKITQLSGRGVGMDVVHNEIKQLGGSLTIDSTRGIGTTFTIRLPFTLAVTQAILVRLGDSTYAIPMSSVQGVVRIASDDLDKRLAQPNPTYTYVGEEFHIYDLWQLLNVAPGYATDEQQLPLLMTRTGDQRAAVRIDSVIGSREIVVKSVGPQISSIPGIFGATIMGDGSVVMILDLAPLVRRNAALRERIRGGEAIEIAAPTQRASMVVRRHQPLVMVVDDSITMRKVTTRVLERNDMDVLTAKDGLDAVEKLQDRVPALMLLDIEMPRMDGYELATYMKNDPRLRRVPIIMITSRTGEKHRQRALEIGVDRYLGKPYQEADLLRNILEILGSNRAEH